MSVQKAKPDFELVLEKVVDATRERVFAAWSRPEQVTQWFAPKPYKLIIHSMDFRTGGRFSMAMRAPDGTEHPFSGAYGEIVVPEKLVWSGEFSSAAPDLITTEVNFAAQGQQTQVRARQTFQVVTPEIEFAVKGAKQGWTMTLDQLAAFCSEPDR
jgi:uncharacterized protein YndB with AHSA1/START domain